MRILPKNPFIYRVFMSIFEMSQFYNIVVIKARKEHFQGVSFRESDQRLFVPWEGK